MSITLQLEQFFYFFFMTDFLDYLWCIMIVFYNMVIALLLEVSEVRVYIFQTFLCIKQIVLNRIRLIIQIIEILLGDN